MPSPQSYVLPPTLVVDADGRAANRLAERLRSAVFAVDIATSYSAARAAMQVRHYGTIVVVANLALMTDLECIARLRALARRTWIIVIAVKPCPDAAHVAFEYGADSVLMAPFAVEELTFRLWALGHRSRPG